MDKEVKREKVGVSNKRGWEALEIKLRERGLTEAEIEEAHDSFYKGIELLAKLFLSYRLREDKTKRIIKGRIDDNSNNR